MYLFWVWGKKNKGKIRKFASISFNPSPPVWPFFFLCFGTLASPCKIRHLFWLWKKGVLEFYEFFHYVERLAKKCMIASLSAHITRNFGPNFWKPENELIMTHSCTFWPIFSRKTSRRPSSFQRVWYVGGWSSFASWTLKIPIFRKLLLNRLF